MREHFGVMKMFHILIGLGIIGHMHLLELINLYT